MLLPRYPSLRVAYIEELEEPSKDKSRKSNQKSYYSVLARAAFPTKSKDSTESVQSLDQVQIQSFVEYRLVQVLVHSYPNKVQVLVQLLNRM